MSERMMPEGGEASRLSALMRLAGRISPIWYAVTALFLVSAMISPAMFQASHVMNMMQVAAFVGVIACGQTLVLLAGGIDLSQAGTVTLINILAAATMMGSDGNIAAALVLCLAVSVGIGLLNALLIVWLRITPLIATLAVNSILFGAALVYTGGAPRGAAAPGFTWIGQGNIAGVAMTTIIWISLALVLAWALKYTVFGRWLYATGANPVAARLMGVPVRAVQASAYILSALFACFGSLLLTAYIGSPSLGIGNQFMFSSVAAAVVGGTALTGGVGSVVATLGGAFFMTELDSFTNIVQVGTGTRLVLQGVLIALSVVLYRAISARRNR